MAVTKEVSFCAVDGSELYADLYRKDAGEITTKTAVLMLHGGGWVQGDRKMMAPMASALADKGFLAIAIQYRLAPQAPWPAQLEDVTAAVKWAKANATDLGIDPERIVLLGNSAGGQLACVATAELGGLAGIAAVVSLFTPGELSVQDNPEKGEFNAAMLLGDGAPEQLVENASPLHRLKSDFPPVFLLHGTADWLVDPVSSIRMYSRLFDLGVTVELHLVAGAHHEFVSEPDFLEPVASEIALFLDRLVVNRSAWEDSAKATNIFAQGPEALQALISAEQARS